MLYIFDKDNTLVRPVGTNNNMPASKPSEQVLYDGVSERCEALRKEGHILAIASNQGGVAFGLVSREDALAMMQDASDKIGAKLFALCVVHPKGEQLGMVRNSIYRKPGPGMIQYLMDALGFAPQDTVYIGDLDSDREAAEAAKVKFEWANEFFGRPQDVAKEEPEIDSDSVAVIEQPFPEEEDEEEDFFDDDDIDDDADEDGFDEEYWSQFDDVDEDEEDN